jgi:antitoxin HicB
MRYPADIKPDGKFFLVTFPDFPEAITQGDSVEDALVHAADVLESVLDHFIENRLPIPAPSKLKRGQRLVELPASYAAKVLLVNEMVAKRFVPQNSRGACR